MGELKALLLAYQKNLSLKKAMALVTVLRVQGSSYRQPGARMLITEEGEIVGSVSGGCLERSLILQAKKAFLSSFHSPSYSSVHSVSDSELTKVIRYDTTEDGDEHETLSSVALGCQGIVDMSLEILNPGLPHPVLDALNSSAQDEKSFELVTLISAPEGFPLASGSHFFTPPTAFSSAIQGQLKTDLVRLQKNETKTYGEFVFFFEKITPPRRLIIFGASHDSVPLATLGKFLGWHVTVVDCRSAYTVPERFFSQVDEFIKCQPSEISERLPLDRKPLCAVVTHNYFHDLEIVKQLLQFNVAYIGLLGPKKKSQTLLEDLRKEQPHLDTPSLLRLHSPAGIDTGAEGPHAVALSIITEALAVTTERKGGFLRDRKEPIHTRT
jgi:xanthine dehydrogenase accessory factor